MYIYQPQPLPDYQQALKLFLIKHPRAREGWPNPMPYLEEISREIESLGIPLQPLQIPSHEYWKYRERVPYPPDYYPNNLTEKSFEHFVAMRLLQPKGVFVDIAAEHSPFAAIVRQLCRCDSYSQDAMYSTGIVGDRIGGDACAIPVPNNFMDAAALTCSLEHFEGDGDTRLFRELARTLSRGGRAVIVPLYIYTKPVIVTDPRYSLEIDIPFDEDAALYCWAWPNRHGRFYSATTLKSRVIDLVPELSFRIYRLTRTEDIDPAIYARFVLVAEKN